MDWLAHKVVEALEKNISDENYLLSKKQELDGLNRLSVARKIAMLDQDNQQSLADILDVELVELRAFLRVLSKI